VLLKYSEDSICSQLFKQHNVPDATTHAAKVLLVVRAQTDRWYRQRRTVAVNTGSHTHNTFFALYKKLFLWNIVDELVNC